MLDITKIHEEFQAQVEQWMAGEPLPEVGPDGDRIAFSEKELETAIATSSIDSAIRLLALKKKPVPEITSRLFALAEDNHPIATHWFQHPLPATFQIMVHWDKRHNLGATKRIADLATDIVQHWMWVSEPDENGQQRDPYGRSSYRPPKAAAGVEQRVHGVTTQGKTVTTALGHKQEEQK